MKEKGVPSCYQRDQQSVNFVDLGKEFNGSKYGEVLRHNVRYGKFKPDDMPHTQWEKLLGADVNNLHHLKLSLELTRRFIDGCANKNNSSRGRVSEEATFSPREQSLLQLTAIAHDWGEAVIGDIPLPDKTKADEKKEMLVLRGIIHEVLGERNDKNFRNEIADNVTEILSNPTTKLGKAFNAIEYVGYTRTGLRAWDQSQKTEGHIKSHLEQMALQVVPNAVSRLITYAEVYPPVNTYLNFHQDRIHHIFETAEQTNVYIDREIFMKAKKRFTRFAAGLKEESQSVQ